MAPPEGAQAEPETVQEAKRALTASKRNVTRHINYVENHIQNESPDVPSNQVKAKLLVEQLDLNVDKFQQCIDALERLGIDPKDDIERYEERWIQTKVDYADWTSRIPTPEKTNGKVIIGRNFNIQKEIPKFFSGEKDNRQYYRTWRMKWDEAAKEMTALGYSKAKQLCELKMVVEGEALRWIEGLPEDGENLDSALHLLDEHYKSNIRDVLDILKDLYKATEMVPTKESLTHGLQVVLLARQALAQENVKKKEDKKPGQNPSIPGGFSGQRKDQKPHKDGNNSQNKKFCAGCNEAGHWLVHCNHFTKTLKTGKERREFLKGKNACRNCLRSNHKTSECKIPSQCKCGVAGHHRLLHEDREPKGAASTQKEDPSSDETKLSYAIRTKGKDGNPILQSCLAHLLGEKGEKFVARVFLDPGSEVTLIRRDFAQIAGLKGKDVTLQLAVAGGGVTEQTKEMEVAFQLQSMDLRYVTPKMVATTTKTITKDLRAVDVSTDKFEHLKNIKFTEHFPRREVQVDILIGINHYTALITGEVIKGKPDEPVALATKLGYVLAGSA